MDNPVRMYYVYDKKVEDLEDQQDPEQLLHYKILREKAKFYSLKLIKNERGNRVETHG